MSEEEDSTGMASSLHKKRSLVSTFSSTPTKNDNNNNIGDHVNVANDSSSISHSVLKVEAVHDISSKSPKLEAISKKSKHQQGHDYEKGQSQAQVHVAPSNSPSDSTCIRKNNNDINNEKLQSSNTNINKSDKNSKENDNNKTSRDYYFDSYSHYGIHEEMLKDEVRTKTYQNAILQNKHLFKDKIVLDVGCGTGILAMFCAQAGAKHVYGIDSSNIINQAQIIIEKNGFKENITLIKGKVEEVELPLPTYYNIDQDQDPQTSSAIGDKDNQSNDQNSLKFVDIIVSEWMGYFLLYESMLDTVLFARDKWLVPNNGIIFPDKAVMYLCGVEDAQVKRERITFWENIYGFDFTTLRDIAIQEPVVDTVESSAVVTNSVPIKSLDLLTCTKDDLIFKSDFALTAERNDYIHGLVAFFECAFTQVHKPIGFSTSPFARYTHWKQTIFYFVDTITVCKGEVIEGTISCKPNENNNRDLDIGFNLTLYGEYTKFAGKNIDFYLR